MSRNTHRSRTEDRLLCVHPSIQDIHPSSRCTTYKCIHPSSCNYYGDTFYFVSLLITRCSWDCAKRAASESFQFAIGRCYAHAVPQRPDPQHCHYFHSLSSYFKKSPQKKNFPQTYKHMPDWLKPWSQGSSAAVGSKDHVHRVPLSPSTTTTHPTHPCPHHPLPHRQSPITVMTVLRPGWIKGAIVMPSSASSPLSLVPKVLIAPELPRG